MRRLYPAGLKRPKDEEYRQSNHRPSYQHGNPVQHRDIMTRICAWDKSANAATAVRRPEKTSFAEMRSARPDRRPWSVVPTIGATIRSLDADRWGDEVQLSDIERQFCFAKRAVTGVPTRGLTGNLGNGGCPAQRRAKLTSFPRCLTIPPRYHGDLEPSPAGWMLESINMTNWKADLDALVEATTQFTKSVRVEPPMPRTIVEPNRMPPVNLNNSERDEIRQRVANFRAHQHRLIQERKGYAASEWKRMLASRPSF